MYNYRIYVCIINDLSIYIIYIIYIIFCITIVSFANEKYDKSKHSTFNETFVFLHITKLLTASSHESIKKSDIL